MNIIQKGNAHTNSSSREGHVPFIIVDHISAGSMSSMDSWFTSPSNTVSSAHFGVSKSGKIHQYVPITRMAWANGLTTDAIPKAAASLVRQNAPVNPNKYTVSIEHEGTDGNLTEAQFAATVELHRFIAAEVKWLYGQALLLDEQHVIGHFQVDPARKPNCPGPKFPWSRLYQALSSSESVRIENVPDVKEEMGERPIPRGSDGNREEAANMTTENATLSARMIKLEEAAQTTAERIKLLEGRVHQAEAQWNELRKTNQLLSNQLHQLVLKLEASSVPAWAEEAFSFYSDFIHEPSGTTEFWRLLTIMYRARIASVVQTSK
ncbi:N-acetylmuramoyl-L-alanine amidase [Gorillibacterium timonense]|uniref:N-acetylmuramoyl-L-alanine amidase n=1 Tax=Gorillibacterium timonense TaxID=1689269 RepID=UPI00071DE5F9|nr:N-acetylmuramoyl-L-alanine amidase [Gorillibacterium timonense]